MVFPIHEIPVYLYISINKIYKYTGNKEYITYFQYTYKYMQQSPWSVA